MDVIDDIVSSLLIPSQCAIKIAVNIIFDRVQTVRDRGLRGRVVEPFEKVFETDLELLLRLFISNVIQNTALVINCQKNSRFREGRVAKIPGCK